MGAALLLGACRSIEVPLTPTRVAGEEERIARWLERARSSGDSRLGLRAYATVKLRSPSGAGSVKQVLIAERPARLRLESLGLLGQTRSLLVTDGSRYSFFDGRELEHGPVSEDLLRQRLGLDLTPDGAVALLLAAPKLEPRGPLEIFGLGEERIARFDDLRVHFTADGELRSVEFFDAQGRLQWSAGYNRWRPVSGGRYPFRVVLDFPQTALHVEFALDEVELNPALGPGIFVLPQSVIASP